MKPKEIATKISGVLSGNVVKATAEFSGRMNRQLALVGGVSIDIEGAWLPPSPVKCR